MRKKHKDFDLVLDYIEAGATSHARNFRDVYDTQPITVRRHIDQWADLAREWQDGLAPTEARATSGEAWETDAQFAQIRAAVGKGRGYSLEQWPGDAPAMRASRYAVAQLGRLTDYNKRSRTPEIYTEWKAAQ